MIKIFILVLFINFYIFCGTLQNITGNIEDLPDNIDAILVLGARVLPPEGLPSDILRDRLLTAIDVYNKGKSKKIIVSGDHGTHEYDEVNAMKNFLLSAGIPKEDIFLDHTGFDTYDSVVRAKEIFRVSSLIVSTQEFHLPRAVFIGKAKGMETYGIKADRQKYRGEIKNNLREYLARVKAFFEVAVNASPRYLGPQIPITGESALSWDSH